jgi:prepilin signal peptidase PulO-like enzyme (type II secretory pathway)
MFWLLAFLIFFFGACVGSFLNVVILRLPKDEKLTGRSHCPNCMHILSAGELVPLFSFFLLGGKCKSCRSKISWRYFVIELATALLFLITWLIQQPHELLGFLFLLKSLIFVSTLIIVFVIDLEYLLIFDQVLIGAGALLLVFNIALDIFSHQAMFSIYSQAFGGLIAGVVFSAAFFLLWLFSKGRWMGFGDVKFMLFLGIVLGWPGTLVCWLLAFVLGTLYAIPLLVSGKKNLESRLSFGTFLSLAGLIALYWGEAIFRWYLSFLGF